MFQALVYSERHTYLLYISSILYLCFFDFFGLFVFFFFFFFFVVCCLLFFDFLIKFNLFFCIEDVGTPVQKMWVRLYRRCGYACIEDVGTPVQKMWVRLYRRCGYACIEDVGTPCEKCYLIWTNITLVFFTIFFLLISFYFSLTCVEGGSISCFWLLRSIIQT